MTRFRLITAALCGALLQACMTVPTADQGGTDTSASTALPQARNFVFSWGMFADPVFDRDVVTFNRTFANVYGAPADIDAFGFTSSRLSTPDPAVMQSELVEMAAQAVDGRDTVVVMLTSHGSPDLMAVKTQPNGPVSAVSADTLAEFLAPLANDRQILILQACFSGSLIDELRSPNRIIMTAASADRSSFGCNPESDNTWFIRSLNRAMLEVGAQGGSWEQIFARTRALVAADEAANGYPASNPQRFVGANMRSTWTTSAM
ncbi:C13 family peptidase [Octadecabacter sp. G9-8]|uniref:C13 family peptidase n=1 Tax=Octadecabacter dasysiphoniae TaxID=2909341 RepID=A0ABS9CYD3_9RHOB|nr:C13 family peptidase [Octadecabacter dasysiphoniae]MCF2871916.1 C13 family peptidase [Octadecabacter dasysiphoniae]